MKHLQTFNESVESQINEAKGDIIVKKLNNKILDTIFDKSQNVKAGYDPSEKAIEISMDNDFILTIDELKKLNQFGLLYETEQLDIDYEDEGPDDIKYMNIYYFKIN